MPEEQKFIEAVATRLVEDGVPGREAPSFIATAYFGWCFAQEVSSSFDDKKRVVTAVLAAARRRAAQLKEERQNAKQERPIFGDPARGYF